MSKKFIYNSKTHILHIEGYCVHAKKGLSSYHLEFDTETEALAYDGRSVAMCKICEKKRLQKMKED